MLDTSIPDLESPFIQLATCSRKYSAMRSSGIGVSGRVLLGTLLHGESSLCVRVVSCEALKRP
jgi:hypothetical protein